MKQKQIVYIHLMSYTECYTDNIGDLVPPVAVFWYR